MCVYAHRGRSIALRIDSPMNIQQQLYGDRTAFSHYSLKAHSLYINTDHNSATFFPWWNVTGPPEFTRRYTEKLATRLQQDGLIEQAAVDRLSQCGQLRPHINYRTGKVQLVEFTCKSRACFRCQQMKQKKLVKAFQRWFPALAHKFTVDGIFISVGFPNVPASELRSAFDDINSRISNLVRSRNWRPHFPYYLWVREFDIRFDSLIHPNIHMLVLLVGDKEEEWNELHEIRWREELVEKLQVNPTAVDVQLVRGTELSARIENETTVFGYMHKAQNYVYPKRFEDIDTDVEWVIDDTAASDGVFAQCTVDLYLQTYRFRRIAATQKLNSLRRRLIAGNEVAIEPLVRWSPSTRYERKLERLREKHSGHRYYGTPSVEVVKEIVAVMGYGPGEMRFELQLRNCLLTAANMMLRGCERVRQRFQNISPQSARYLNGIYGCEIVSINIPSLDAVNAVGDDSR